MRIVPARITHTRSRPRRNAFAYTLCYFAVPLSQWSAGGAGKLFSIDKPNLFSLRSRDYADGKTPLLVWVRKILGDFEFAEADGEVVLLTLPRFLGFAFNPVSFWLCFDRQEGLRAVLAEVNNTFGERHVYFCACPDHRAIDFSSPLQLQKVFHVSPFMDVKGDYIFRFAYSERAISVQIDLVDGEKKKLATTMSGRFAPLTSLALVRAALSHPLQSVKVTALIHFQALLLFLKGVKIYRKPPPPASFVSR